MLKKNPEPNIISKKANIQRFPRCEGTAAVGRRDIFVPRHEYEFESWGMRSGLVQLQRSEWLNAFEIT